MRFGSVRAVLVIGPLVFMLSACTDELANYVPPPMNPTSPTILTETFSGSMLAYSSAVNYYTWVSGAGPVTATLTSVIPAGTPIGVGIGVWNGLSLSNGLTCTVEVSNTQMTTANTLLGTATHGIYLCAEVYDPGTLTTGVSYTLQVTHY
jgi:hypothetical protein